MFRLASEIASAAGETQQTHKALERAVETSPSRPEAWKALASLAKASHDTDAIIRTNSKLVRVVIMLWGAREWLSRGFRGALQACFGLGYPSALERQKI